MPEKIDQLCRIVEKTELVYKSLEEIYPNYPDKEAIEAYCIYWAGVSEGEVKIKTRNDKTTRVNLFTQKFIERITGVSPYRWRKFHKHIHSSPEEVKEKVFEMIDSLYQ